jgi:hypothetical protein
MKLQLHLKKPVFCALVCVLAGCSRSQEPPWNVSAIMGQPIEAAKRTLGTPQQELLPPTAGPVAALPSPTAQSTWKSDDTTLSAIWNTGNKRVTSWTLSRPDADAVREEDKAALLRPGRLQENDSRYSVEWLEAPERPLFYSGAKIIPAPKNHAVTLRVTGGSALLEISYQTGGPQSQNETFITIAPWEIKTTLPDGAQVMLQSRVVKAGGGGTSEVNVEIISDGKAVARASSTGQPVKCQFEL